MRTIRTAEKRVAFVEALSLNGNVCAAAKTAGVGRTAVYSWRDRDPEFAKAWDAALELGIDGLEDEAVRRAHEGTVKPVFYQGVECGGIREYSDTLLMFMLKARRPARFADRHQHSGSDGGPTSYVMRTNSGGRQLPSDPDAISSRSDMPALPADPANDMETNH